MSRISLCLIARDEERFLPGCLESVSGVVDEIVLADTGSTDRTVALAEEAGAIVVHHEWNEDFSAARNVALEAATGDWILILDADERLGPGTGSALRAAVDRGGFYCGLIRLTDADCLDAPLGEVLNGSAALREPVLLARLFRRTTDLRWEGRVHEHVNTWLRARGGRATVIPGDIVHYGAVQSLRKEKGKDERNLRLLRQEVQEVPDNWSVRACLAETCWEMGHQEEAREHAQIAWDTVIEDLAHWGDIPCGVVKALTVLVVGQLQEGRFDAALVALRSAERLGIQHPNPSYLGGLARENLALHEPDHREDHLERAAAAFEQALSYEGKALLDPPVAGAAGWCSRLRLGLVRLQQGRWEEARSLFEQVETEEPGSMEARLGLAEVCLEQGRPAQTLRLLESLLSETAPSDTWLLAADAFRMLGNAEGFSTCLQQAYGRVREDLVGLHRLERLNSLLAVAS